MATHDGQTVSVDATGNTLSNPAESRSFMATGAQHTFVYHYGIGGELIGETVYSSAGAKVGERDYVWLETLPIAQSERDRAHPATYQIQTGALLYLMFPSSRGSPRKLPTYSSRNRSEFSGSHAEPGVRSGL